MHSVDRLRQARVAQGGEGRRMEVVTPTEVHGPFDEQRAYGKAIELQLAGVPVQVWPVARG